MGSWLPVNGVPTKQGKSKPCFVLRKVSIVFPSLYCQLSSWNINHSKAVINSVPFCNSGSVEYGVNVLRGIQPELKTSEKLLNVILANLCTISNIAVLFCNFVAKWQRTCKWLWTSLIHSGCCNGEWIWENSPRWSYSSQWSWSEVWWYWSPRKCEGYVKRVGYASLTKAWIVL